MDSYADTYTPTNQADYDIDLFQKKMALILNRVLSTKMLIDAKKKSNNMHSYNNIYLREIILLYNTIQRYFARVFEECRKHFCPEAKPVVSAYINHKNLDYINIKNFKDFLETLKDSIVIYVELTHKLLVTLLQNKYDTKSESKFLKIITDFKQGKMWTIKINIEEQSDDKYVDLIGGGHISDIKSNISQLQNKLMGLLFMLNPQRITHVLNSMDPQKRRAMSLDTQAKFEEFMEKVLENPSSEVTSVSLKKIHENSQDINDLLRLIEFDKSKYNKNIDNIDHYPLEYIYPKLKQFSDITPNTCGCDHEESKMDEIYGILNFDFLNNTDFVLVTPEVATKNIHEVVDITQDQLGILKKIVGDISATFENQHKTMLSTLKKIAQLSQVVPLQSGGTQIADKINDNTSYYKKIIELSYDAIQNSEQTNKIYSKYKNICDGTLNYYYFVVGNLHYYATTEDNKLKKYVSLAKLIENEKFYEINSENKDLEIFGIFKQACKFIRKIVHLFQKEINENKYIAIDVTKKSFPFLAMLLTLNNIYDI